MTDDGSRLVQLLFEQTLQEGLTNTDAQGDVECLHALFDVAVSHGLGNVVLDYVVEVCSDPFLTSRYVGNSMGPSSLLFHMSPVSQDTKAGLCSDPIEATLLDGRCVKRWCHGAIERLWSHAGQSPELGAHAAVPFADPVAAISSLVLVAEVLVHSGQGDHRCWPEGFS